jgi:hypothetical protein
LSEILRTFSLRYLHRPAYINPFSNRSVVVGSLIALALSCIVVYVPGVQSVFGTASPPWYGLLVSVLVALLSFGVDEYLKTNLHQRVTSRQRWVSIFLFSLLLTD